MGNTDLLEKTQNNILDQSVELIKRKIFESKVIKLALLQSTLLDSGDGKRDAAVSHNTNRQGTGEFRDTPGLKQWTRGIVVAVLWSSSLSGVVTSAVPIPECRQENQIYDK